MTCYTVVFTKLTCWISDDKKTKDMYVGKVLYIGMSRSGSYYHDVADSRSFYPGSQIGWDKLTDEQKKVVVEEYEECWKIVCSFSDGKITGVRPMSKEEYQKSCNGENWRSEQGKKDVA